MASTSTSGPRARRGGRNLPVAVAVGMVLAALVLISLYTVRWAFVAVVVVAVVLAVHEVSSAVRRVGMRLPAGVISGGGVVMLVAAYVDGGDALAAAFLLTLVAGAVARLFVGGARVAADVLVAALVVIWVPLLAAFTMLLLAEPDGPDRVVALVLVVALSDTGGLVVGILAGRHPMAPHVSPKKSWEGLLGSCALGVGGAAVALPWLLHITWWQGAVVGATLVVTATLGDLAESLVKRDVGVKDMSHLLPQHGGVMDRLDSLLPSAPVAALLLWWLV